MNNTYLAIVVSVALLGAVIGVQYFYGWNNVKEDVTAMGKSVWFSFKEWVGVKTGNKTVLMPEELTEEKDIIETGLELETEVPIIGRFMETGERLINRFTNSTLKNIAYISNVNTTNLQNKLSDAIGTSVEFVNITLKTGRNVIMPIENATRRAMGGQFQAFVSNMRNSFEQLFTSGNIDYMLKSIMVIPQQVVFQVQNLIYELGHIGQPPQFAPMAPLSEALSRGGKR
jgi:hypothetical protein